MGQDAAVSTLFDLYDRNRIDPLIAHREGETKLGAVVQLPAEKDLAAALRASTAKFVLLGIPEDIGVRANGGVGGAHTLWEPALKALLNIQSTDSLPGDELLVLGAFRFDTWMEESLPADVATLRQYVTRIDEAVAPVIEAIVAAGKIPVVIGGGHNNAYPLLKGTSLGLQQAINCINLDAHSDYRVMEGRHSGNGFRYAKHEGFLSHYAIIGLHRNYNSRNVLKDIRQDTDLQVSFYEDIFLRDMMTFQESVLEAIDHTAGKPTGIELDLDCIAGVLSSAATPAGISALQARQYVRWCAQSSQPAYLHLTEGAVQLRDGRTDGSTAKLVAYLVSDFIRGFNGH